MGEIQQWEAACRGDDGAFAAIFELHEVRVVRHAAHLLADRNQAEDVAAAAFLELWRRRRRVRIVNESVLPWLLATTTNLARNSNRSLQRYEAMLRKLPRSSEPTPDMTDLFDAPLSPEQAVALSKAMGALSSRDAALLTLTALEGMTTADAARAIGIRPDTARVRLHRAKATARHIIQTHEPEVTP